MDEQYEKSIKWVKISAYFIGLALTGFGAAKVFVDKDMWGMAEFVLLGLACLIGLLSLASKMSHDLKMDKENNKALYPDEEQHDIGY